MQFLFDSLEGKKNPPLIAIKLFFSYVQILEEYLCSLHCLKFWEEGSKNQGSDYILRAPWRKKSHIHLIASFDQCSCPL